MSLLTVFTTGKAAYDLLEPLVGKLFVRMGWRKDDKRRAAISSRMRELVREAREVVATTRPEHAGSRLQAMVDRLREELQRDGVPREDALLFTDQASAVLVMVAFGSIDEWFLLRSRTSELEARLAAQESVARELKGNLEELAHRQRSLQIYAVASIAIAVCSLLLSLVLVLRR